MRANYFCDQASEKWYALVYDGHQATFELVVSHAFPPARVLQTVFDVVWREGPLGLSRRGELYFPEVHEFRRPAGIPDGPFDKVTVSQCGNWISVRNLAALNRAGVIDVANQQYIPNRSGKNALNELESIPWVQPPKHPLLRRFRGVAIDAHLGLVLVSPKGRVSAVQWDDARGQMRFGRFTYPTNDSLDVRDFDERSFTGGNRWGVRCAKWADGSRAYLDDRCLLHLRSSNPDVPEVTLVLFDGEIAGWCADGRTWGNLYFLVDSPNGTASDIWHAAIRPFIEQLE
jgi:hypothetical protein